MASRVARSHANTTPTSPTPTAKQTAAKLQHHEKEKETAARGLARVGCEEEGAKPADEEPEERRLRNNLTTIIVEDGTRNMRLAYCANVNIRPNPIESSPRTPPLLVERSIIVTRAELEKETATKIIPSVRHRAAMSGLWHTHAEGQSVSVADPLTLTRDQTQNVEGAKCNQLCSV